jgi:3-hydroxyacyl-[acyl-carrier-protein] dehydratase
MAADRTTRERILAAVPQRPPFRFIDEILELDQEHIVGAYRFRPDEYFYAGHFPGRPVTPGVILIETMAQTGVVAFGLYLGTVHWGLPLSEVSNMLALFTNADDVEFNGIVLPGERVLVRGEKIYLRRRNMKAKVRMTRESGEEVSTSVLSGMAVLPAEIAAH